MENTKSISLYPYVQVGKEKDHPYIFQGLHKSKEEVAILNLIAGNEEAQSAKILERVFEPMRSSLQGGAGQVLAGMTSITPGTTYTIKVGSGAVMDPNVLSGGAGTPGFNTSLSANGINSSAFSLTASGGTGGNGVVIFWW